MCYDDSMQSKVVVGVAIVVLGIGGLFLWDKSQKNKECEDRALAASVDTYPISEYPNTDQRAALQEDYERRYMSNCQ